VPNLTAQTIVINSTRMMMHKAECVASSAIMQT